MYLILLLFRVVSKTSISSGAIRQLRTDCRGQTEQIRKAEAEMAEKRRTATLVQVFVRKCYRDTRNLSAAAEELRDFRTSPSDKGGVFRDRHEEKVIADDASGQVKSAAQVRLGSERPIIRLYG